MGLFPKTFTILVVCKANITRSAYLQGYMETYLREHLPLLRRKVRVRSAGIQARRSASASQVMQHVAKLNGFSLAGHRSSPLTRRTVRSSDVILVMERSQQESILQHFPEAEGKTFRLTEYLRQDDHGRAFDIPDPTGLDYTEYNGFVEVAHAEVERIFRELGRDNSF